VFVSSAEQFSFQMLAKSSDSWRIANCDGKRVSCCKAAGCKTPLSIVRQSCTSNNQVIVSRWPQVSMTGEA